MFGGSFDPPHNGHFHVAETALKRLQLDEVWWFPTPGNPLKNAPGDYQTRLEAVRAMTARNRAMHVSEAERHILTGYSIDLILQLKQHCRRASLVWLIGADSLMTMHYWKDWKQIAESIPIAVIARPGFGRAARTSRFAKVFRNARRPANAASCLLGASTPAWTYLPAPLRNISSTKLRRERL